MKLEAVKLEEEKKMVKDDARLGLRPMTDGPIDVQLRWANLRAREHHVKGPKKSPRKMVLRRLILRKAEEARRGRGVCRCFFAVDHPLKINYDNYSCYLQINF